MPYDDKLGRRLKLNELRALMTVVEAGGIGKAADRLNYSQPAISKAIASLERTLGKRLLERSRKGIELTSYGDALIKCGVAVFDDLRKGLADIDYLSDPAAGKVRIGCSEPVSAGIVATVIEHLARRYPRIVFDVVLRAPASIYRELEARNVDFVIAQLIGHVEDQDHMQCEVLYREAVVVVAGAQHPCARKRRMRLADLADESWTLPLAGSFIYKRVVEAFRANGLNPPNVAVIGASAYLRIMLVASGRFLTVVPAGMLQAGLKQLPIKRLPLELPGDARPVGIVTLKNRALSPVAQLFIEHTRMVAKAMARD